MHQVGLHWSVSVNLCNDTINALCTNVCNYLQIKNDVENFVYKKMKKNCDAQPESDARADQKLFHFFVWEW